MIFEETKTLSNGVKIPVLGLGTWQIKDAVAENAVKSALEIGYRHIDTAAAYENENGVGRGIKTGGPDRRKIFITSKIPAEYKNFDIAKKTIETSLKLLGTDYIDLMLIHAPRPWDEMGVASAYNYNKENLAVWKALEEAYEEGKVRAIGVSNFGVSDLKNIMDNGRHKPLVNQICCYIGNTPSEIIGFDSDNDIVTEAYSPIATGRLLGDSKIAAVAEKYGVSVPQLCIKYVLQLGAVALPKTTHKEYMAQNALLDFVISYDDM